MLLSVSSLILSMLIMAASATAVNFSTLFFSMNPLSTGISIATEDLVCNGKAFLCDHQGHQYLWLLRLVVLRKSILSQLVFLEGLEIERRDVVKKQFIIETVALPGKVHDRTKLEGDKSGD